ncbi:MAG: hypothetical protein RL319_121 [Actinomycetota bacterium]|jgi:hypothetical protein
MVQKIGRVAAIAAVIGPIQSIAGWTISGLIRGDNYDPIRQPISDLAALDSSVFWLQSAFFMFGASLWLIAAFSAKAFAWPGRAALLISAIATVGLTIFPTPSQTSSSELHRFFAILQFVLMTAFPLLAMRFKRDYHWLIRPPAAITATVIMTAIALWFLAVWVDPNATNVGFVERVIAVAQTLYLSGVVLVIYRWQSRNARLG